MTTKAYLSKLPNCDFHINCGKIAKYDAQTTFGPWAYMCKSHFKEHAYSKKLGLGLGQELFLRKDKIK